MPFSKSLYNIVFVKGEIIKFPVLFKSLSPFVGHRAFFKSLSFCGTQGVQKLEGAR